jgi:multidrug resistance efflux pump
MGSGSKMSRVTPNKRISILGFMAALVVYTPGCSRTTVPVKVIASSESAETTRNDPAKRGSNIVVASPGRVEGRTETVQIGAGADGIVSKVLVSEGQEVRRGTLLAQIDCRDIQASLASAEAEAQSALHVKERLIRGSRDEERLAAEQKTLAAKAVFNESSIRLHRLSQLRKDGIISVADLDRAQKDYDVAEADLKEAQRNEELVKASALAEDVNKADSDILAADFRVTSLREKIGKCSVTAPISGTILRVLMREGEAYSTMAPQPLFTMADLSVRRIRAEVDERDVLKVHIGQHVLISTEADQDDRYSGVVESLLKTMGRKHIQSADPAEKSDRDVLETIVQLDQTVNLPVGMRVIVKFQATEDKSRQVPGSSAEAPETFGTSTAKNLPSQPAKQNPSRAIQPSVAPPVIPKEQPGSSALQSGRDLLYQGKYPAAITKLSEAIGQQPDLAVAYNSRGFAYYLSRDYNDALADLNEAIHLNPSYVNAYQNRQLVRNAAGDLAGSHADATKVHELLSTQKQH